MQRRFFSNLTLLFILNGLVKPLWIFGIDRKVQLVIGSVQYGGYYSMLNLSMILSIFLDIGITSYVTREVARRPEIVPRYMGSLILIKSILLALYLILVFIIAALIHIPFVSFGLLFGVVVLQCLLSMLQFLRAHISGMHLFVQDSFLSVFDKLLVIIICSGILYVGVCYSSFNIYTFIIIQNVALGFACIVGLLTILKHVKHLKFKIDKTLTKTILKESKPYALMVLFMAAYNRIDGVMLERLAGAEYAGQYAKDFRLLDACGQFGVLFAGLLLPIFVRMLREKKNVSVLAGNAFAILYCMGIVIALVSTFYAIPIHKILYHENRQGILNIIMWAFIGNSTMYVFSTLLTANGNIYNMITLAVIGLATNFCINIFITQSNAMVIASTACTVTQTLVALIAVWFCYKKNIINLKFSYWGRLLLFTVFLFVVSYTIAHQVTGFFIGATIIIASAFIGILLFRIIALKQILELIKKPVF